MFIFIQDLFDFLSELRIRDCESESHAAFGNRNSHDIFGIWQTRSGTAGTKEISAARPEIQNKLYTIRDFWVLILVHESGYL